jgi:hypothetical protein
MNAFKPFEAGGHFLLGSLHLPLTLPTPNLRRLAELPVDGVYTELDISDTPSGEREIFDFYVGSFVARSRRVIMAGLEPVRTQMEAVEKGRKYLGEDHAITVSMGAATIDGDIERLRGIRDAVCAGWPDFAEAILFERERAWATALRGDGCKLVIVGVLHIPGLMDLLG